MWGYPPWSGRNMVASMKEQSYVPKVSISLLISYKVSPLSPQPITTYSPIYVAKVVEGNDLANGLQ